MSKHTHPTRRTFVQGAAGLVAAGALAAPALAQATESSAKDSAASTKRWSWESAPAPVTDIVRTEDVDIVVVGGGIAGVTATWSAAKAGASVTCVEKTDQVQGRSMFIGAINAQVQKDAGVPEYNSLEIMQEMHRFQGGFVMPDLYKMYLDNSGMVWDKLAELAKANGAEPLYMGDGSLKQVDHPYYSEYTTMMYITPTNAELVSYLQADAEESGATFAFNSPAEQLVVDGDKVTGVICKTQEGYVQYNAAEGVVMATGDYSGNPEMMQAWAPMSATYADFSMYTPAGANSGDGLAMMMWAGAVMQPCDEHAPMIHCLGGATGSANAWLRVNANGERYENEDVPNAQVCYGRFMQPGNKAWAIYDANCGTYAAQMTYGFGRSASVTQENLDADVENGLALRADTLEELAELMGVPSAAFATTVARYNELCEAGEDADYGKDAANLTPVDTAPFYAAPIKAPLLVMLGGINVDKYLRVCNAENQPIEGLYAIGNCSGNYYAVDYPAIIPGMSHGRCVTTGYLIGEALAKGTLIGQE